MNFNLAPTGVDSANQRATNGSKSFSGDSNVVTEGFVVVGAIFWSSEHLGTGHFSTFRGQEISVIFYRKSRCDEDNSDNF
jgi:hypothetical protein